MHGIDYYGAFTLVENMDYVVPEIDSKAQRIMSGIKYFK
jgi:hypothetical protein